MKNKVITVTCALLSVIVFALTASADEKSGGKVKFQPFTVKGAVVGARVKIDDAYAKKYGIAVPAAFEFIVPKSDDVLIFPAYPSEKIKEYIKISFATKEKKLIENIRFANMAIPMGETEARLKTVAALLNKQGLPMALKGKQKAKVIGTRTGKYGKNDGVEVWAQYEEPAIGMVVMRLVGILNPDSKHCIFAFANVVPAVAGYKKLDEIGTQSINAKILGTVRFIK